MSSRPQNINEDTYTIAIDNASKAATLTGNYGPNAVAIFTNLSDKAVFVVSGVTSPTAVFPTSASVPVQGKVIPAGAVMSFDLPQEHVFISAIQLVSGTGNLYISIGNTGV